MNGAGLAGDEADVEAMLAARQDDPFAVLGPHQTAEGWAIRAFVPFAGEVRAIGRDGAPIVTLATTHGRFLRGARQGPEGAAALSARGEHANARWSYEDGYAFGPALGPLDDHLLVEGTHRQLYRRLGAQVTTHEGVDGVLFALWAPNASRVSIVGDFNQWDGRRCQMRKRVDSGLWEFFAPGLGAGAVYKYEIISAGRRAAAAQGRSLRLRGRDASLDRLGRRAHR